MRPTRFFAPVVASLVSVAVAILGFPAAASAATVTTTTSNGLHFEADDTNNSAGATVVGYTGTGSSLVIPPTVLIDGISYPVTSIAAGTQGFQSFVATVPGSFTSLVIPDSVTDIGEYAFYNDTTLTSVSFGTGITAIHDGAFRNDPLGSIVLPNSLGYIGAFVFISATEATLTLPEGLTDIEGQAFLHDNSLTTVTLPSTLTSINSLVFDDDPALRSVLFSGRVPTGVVGAGGADGQTFDPSGGLVISYLWAHDAAQEAGGFTSPTWLGYNTQEFVTRTFDANGFGTAPALQRFAIGGTASKPVNPTAAGKAFLGWYTSPALTTKADFADPVAADETLYAGWASLATTGVDVSPAAVIGAGGALGIGVLMLALTAWRRRRVAATSVR